MKGDSLDVASECKRIKKNAFFDSALRSGKEKAQLRTVGLLNWWPGAESNCRHADFQKTNPKDNGKIRLKYRAKQRLVKTTKVATKVLGGRK